MEFEKVFTKNYKKVCMDITNERIENRIEGINAVIEQFDSYKKIAEIVKLYWGMDCDSEIKEEFVSCFYNVDMTFDEQNAEEISVLAGCTLLKIIQENEDVQLAYSVKILERFYEGKVADLSCIASEVIDMQTRAEKQVSVCQSLSWKKEWESDIIDENGKVLSTATQAIVELLKAVKTQFTRVNNYTRSLLEINEKCEEKIAVLSWIIGEWSDLLQKPLSEVDDVEGTLVLGVELAELVNIPGPFAAEAFLSKMLAKCKHTAKEISLTELIDKQEEGIRQYVSENYCEEAEEKNLLILSAVKDSLTVDEEKAWVPAYKKRWKINPDTVTFTLRDWSKLIYFECMISK